jgi:hypothetical protein
MPIDSKPTASGARVRSAHRAALLVPLILLGIVSCAALQEIAALRTVVFALDRVDQVRLAGIRLDGRSSYSDLNVAEVARLTAAVVTKNVPLDLVVHVRAENPAENPVAARLVDFDWTLFLEDRETVSGTLSGNTPLPPGQPVDIPIAATLDLFDFFGGNARDLFELALALAGQGGASKEVRLEALPTVQTSLGPITYPGRIVLRRQVGAR